MGLQNIHTPIRKFQSLLPVKFMVKIVPEGFESREQFL